MKKNCEFCGKEFDTKPCWYNKARFCSRKCWGFYQRGKHISEDHRKKIIKSSIGKKHSEETKKKIRESNKGKHRNNLKKYWNDPIVIKNRCENLPKGEKHPSWKGEKVKVEGLHSWVRKYKPKPELCECCKKAPPYDLANISKKYNRKTYTRDIENWVWICRLCHLKQDGRLKRLIKISKSRGKKNERRRMD